MGLRAGAQPGRDGLSAATWAGWTVRARGLTPRGRLPMLLLRNSESGVEGSSPEASNCGAAGPALARCATPPPKPRNGDAVPQKAPGMAPKTCQILATQRSKARRTWPDSVCTSWGGYTASTLPRPASMLGRPEVSKLMRAAAGGTGGSGDNTGQCQGRNKAAQRASRGCLAGLGLRAGAAAGPLGAARAGWRPSGAGGARGAQGEGRKASKQGQRLASSMGCGYRRKHRWRGAGGWRRAA